jgi:sensor domain CHASE-containing protein
VSAVEPSRFDRTRGRLNPTGWNRTRFGVLVPLCVVVAIAIVCIIVAALKSAQRADEVALGHERQLLTKAIANHGEWSLRRLRTVIKSAVSVSAAEIDQVPELVQRRLGAWLDPLLDHELVVVVNSSDRIIYSQTKRGRPSSELTNAALPKLRAIVDFLRGRTAAMPDKAMRLVEDGQAARPGGVAATVFLQDIDRRLAVITAVPWVGTPGLRSC